MKNKLLLVDFNNLLYRSVFANLSLSHKGTFTGGLYGFLNMLSSTVNRYKIDRVMICKDAKPYARTRHFKEYKQGRGESMSEDDIKRVAIAREQLDYVIENFSIPSAMRVGAEADDFIGAYCRLIWRKYKTIFIMSNDSDFYQLLSYIRAGRIYLVTTGGLYGYHQFKEDYPSIAPDDWPRVIALKGSHNGVAGIKGVGDKTAVKLIVAGVDNEAIYEKYKHFPEQIELRQDLATFPYPRARRLLLPATIPIDYEMFRLGEICDDYGIRFKDEFHNAFLRLSK